MIKNLLLSIVLVFAGLAAFTIVVSLIGWLMAYIDYKKKCYELELNNQEIASKLFNFKDTTEKQPPKEDL